MTKYLQFGLLAVLFAGAGAGLLAVPQYGQGYGYQRYGYRGSPNDEQKDEFFLRPPAVSGANGQLWRIRRIRRVSQRRLVRRLSARGPPICAGRSPR